MIDIEYYYQYWYWDDEIRVRVMYDGNVIVEDCDDVGIPIRHGRDVSEFYLRFSDDKIGGDYG